MFAPFDHGLPVPAVKEAVVDVTESPLVQVVRLVTFVVAFTEEPSKDILSVKSPAEIIQIPDVVSKPCFVLTPFTVLNIGSTVIVVAVAEIPAARRPKS